MIVAGVACSDAINRTHGAVVSVGDSITEGIGTTDPWSNSYRLRMLHANGNLTSNGVFAKNGLKYSAQSGQTSAQILASIPAWFASKPGDLLVLMIGHNDQIVTPGYPATTTASNIADIISACLAVNPALKTLVCPPVNATAPWAGQNPFYDAIEAAMPAALAGITGVTTMTPRPTFVAGDYLDGEHFNDSGCAKFAAFVNPYVPVVGF